MLTIKVEPSVGVYVEDLIVSAIRLARKTECAVMIENVSGVNITVYSNSYYVTVHNAYKEALNKNYNTVIDNVSFDGEDND